MSTHQQQWNKLVNDYRKRTYSQPLEENWSKSRNTFKIQQEKSEWMEVLKLLSEQNKKFDILEIGAHDGGSSYSLSKFASSMITIDNNIKCRFNTQILKEHCDYTYIGGNSHSNEIFNKVKDKKFDVLFIDGDHSYEGVKQDYNMYKPLVKKGGTIIFHDIAETKLHKDLGCRVDILWNEIKTNYTNPTEILHNPNGFGIGIINT
jgi:predicted O-methyltransferase YrrM